MTMIDDKLADLRRAVAAEFDQWAETDERHRKIAKAAKAMARTHGHFCDEITVGWPGHAPAVAGKGVPLLLGQLMPVWAHYITEAAAAVDSMAAEVVAFPRKSAQT